MFDATAIGILPRNAVSDFSKKSISFSVTFWGNRRGPRPVHVCVLSVSDARQKKKKRKRKRNVKKTINNRGRIVVTRRVVNQRNWQLETGDSCARRRLTDGRRGRQSRGRPSRLWAQRPVARRRRRTFSKTNVCRGDGNRT